LTQTWATDDIAPPATGLRLWIWSYVALCTAGVALAVSVSAYRETAVYIVYMGLACTFVPLPTTPMVLFAATRMNAVSVALLGAAATATANLNEYHLWTSFFRYRLFERIRRSRHCRAATAWFDRAPFAALFAANVAPLPVDVVRLIAVARQYDRRRFFAANVLGRGIRYGLIAVVGYVLQPPLWAIIALTGVLFVYGALKAASITRIKTENKDEA